MKCFLKQGFARSKWIVSFLFLTIYWGIIPVYALKMQQSKIHFCTKKGLPSSWEKQPGSFFTCTSLLAFSCWLWSSLEETELSTRLHFLLDPGYLRLTFVAQQTVIQTRKHTVYYPALLGMTLLLSGIWCLFCPQFFTFHNVKDDNILLKKPVILML